MWLLVQWGCQYQVAGFHRRDSTLLTQLPMPSTVTDFWRLVTQYKISVIVAFEVEMMATDHTIAMYVPTSKDISLCSDYFEVKSESIRQDQLWEEQTLKVRSEKSKSQNQPVVHLKCKFTDLDATKLLRLLKKIRSLHAHADGKTLYMCRNGATYSGLCSVLVSLLDKLDSDSRVSVPLVVGAVKTIRPEVVPSMDQYRLVYDVLNRYCDSASPYTNLKKTYTSSSVPMTKTNNLTYDGTSDVSINIYNNV
ncbi:hypothetical protein Btru_017749 [Bulinus truncatus]|nr:hypothetical protein Btru_017749 [Bulinus truncatus]